MRRHGRPERQGRSETGKTGEMGETREIKDTVETVGDIVDYTLAFYLYYSTFWDAELAYFRDGLHEDTTLFL